MRRRVPVQVERPVSHAVSAGGRKGCWRELDKACRLCILGTWWEFPVGEQWNQASIPRPARPVIDEQELGDGATLGHDELYRYRGALPRAWCCYDVPGTVYRTYTRDEADAFLYRHGLLEGADPWRAKLGHAAVRVFWWFAEALRLSRAW